MGWDGEAYFNIQRSDVFDFAHFSDLLLYLVGKSDGGEDCEGAVGEAHNGAAAADLDAAEAGEGDGEGGDGVGD